jgi:hypothetical protein
MSKINKHNKNTGSKIDRDQSRIDETGEVFTPLSLVNEILDQIPSDVFDPDKTWIDFCAGTGNLLIPLVERGVPLCNIYGVEYMEDNFYEMCNRLNVNDICYKLVTVNPIFGDTEDVMDSSNKNILKKGNFIRCDALHPEIEYFFDQPIKFPYQWVPVEEVAQAPSQQTQETL